MIGIHLSAPFIMTKGSCKRAPKHTEKAGSEPKKRKRSVADARTFDITSTEQAMTSQTFLEKGDVPHGLSASNAEVVQSQKRTWNLLRRIKNMYTV